jgi:hypothetical protein
MGTMMLIGRRNYSPTPKTNPRATDVTAGPPASVRSAVQKAPLAPTLTVHSPNRLLPARQNLLQGDQKLEPRNLARDGVNVPRA